MINALLSGVAASAITAQLSSVPLTWSDLYAHTLNNNLSPTGGRTYLIRYAGVNPAPFNKFRITFVCSASSSYTLSKVYVGELASDRSGYFFQNTPTQVFFDGGNPSFTLTDTSSKLSDEIDFNFSGAHGLGIAFYLTARSGNIRRMISSNVAWCYDMAGDVLPDPNNSYGINASTNLMLFNDIDVVFDQALASNKILASRQTTIVVKEGANPSQPNYIRATNQVIYVVKS